VRNNSTYIVGGDNVTLSCRFGFVGRIPSIQWKCTGPQCTYIYSASHFTDNNDPTYPGMSARVSELQIAVQPCAEYLPKYSCHIEFSWSFWYINSGHSPSNYTHIRLRRQYTWATPNVKVSCEYMTCCFLFTR